MQCRTVLVRAQHAVYTILHSSTVQCSTCQYSAVQYNPRRTKSVYSTWHISAVQYTLSHCSVRYHISVHINCAVKRRTVLVRKHSVYSALHRNAAQYSAEQSSSANHSGVQYIAKQYIAVQYISTHFSPRYSSSRPHNSSVQYIAYQHSAVHINTLQYIT